MFSSKSARAGALGPTVDISQCLIQPGSDQLWMPVGHQLPAGLIGHKVILPPSVISCPVNRPGIYAVVPEVNTLQQDIPYITTVPGLMSKPPADDLISLYRSIAKDHVPSFMAQYRHVPPTVVVHQTASAANRFSNEATTIPDCNSLMQLDSLSLKPTTVIQKQLVPQDGFHKEKTTQSRIHQELPSKTSTHQELSSQSRIHENFATQTVAHKDLASQTGIHKDFASSNVIHKDLTSQTGTQKDIVSQAGIHKDFASQTGINKDFAPRNGIHTDIGSQTGIHKYFAPTNGIQKDIVSQTGIHKDLASQTGIQSLPAITSGQIKTTYMKSKQDSFQNGNHIKNESSKFQTSETHAKANVTSLQTEMFAVLDLSEEETSKLLHTAFTTYPTPSSGNLSAVISTPDLVSVLQTKRDLEIQEGKCRKSLQAYLTSGVASPRLTTAQLEDIGNSQLNPSLRPEITSHYEQRRVRYGPKTATFINTAVVRNQPKPDEMIFEVGPPQKRKADVDLVELAGRDKTARRRLSQHPDREWSSKSEPNSDPYKKKSFPQWSTQVSPIVVPGSRPVSVTTVPKADDTSPTTPTEQKSISVSSSKDDTKTSNGKERDCDGDTVFKIPNILKRLF